MPEEGRSPWRTLASGRRYENPRIRVVENDVLDAEGNRSAYGTVHSRERASPCRRKSPAVNTVSR
jgi:hypothetical protein